MILFGTRGVTFTKDRGQFFCPECSDRRPYAHKRVRRFFTLYFIPVIPLDLLGEYIECQRCEATYKLDILNYDPEASAAAFEAEYHGAVMRVMIEMLLADGSVEDEEVQTIRTVYTNITGAELSDEEIRSQVRQAQLEHRGIQQALKQLAPQLNAHGHELVVKAALMVAMADGELHRKEQELLSSVADTLGMSAAHFDGVLRSLQAPAGA